MKPLALLSSQGKSDLSAYLESVQAHHANFLSSSYLSKTFDGISKFAQALTLQNPFGGYQAHAKKREAAQLVIKQVTCPCSRDDKVRNAFQSMVDADAQLESIAKKDFRSIRWIVIPFLAFLTYPTALDQLSKTSFKTWVPDLPTMLTNKWNTPEDCKNFLRLAAMCFIQFSFVRHLFSRDNHSKIILAKQTLEGRVSDLKSELEKPKCGFPFVSALKVVQFINNSFEKIVQTLKETGLKISEKLRQIEVPKVPTSKK